MVKVISIEPHPDVVKQVVCKNCGSTLEYTPQDIFVKTWVDYGGDTNKTQYIECPTCKIGIVIR